MVYMGSSFVDDKGSEFESLTLIQFATKQKIIQVRRLANTIKEGRTMMVTTMLMMGMHLAHAEQFRYLQKVMR